MTSDADWTKAAALPSDALARALDEDHDEVDENPATSDRELAAMRPAKRRPGQRGPGKRPAKVLLSLRIDPAVLDIWKGTGAGWRARINDLLAREAPGRKA